MKDLLIFIGFLWLAFVGVVVLAMMLISKQAREREERMDRDEAEGEE